MRRKIAITLLCCLLLVGFIRETVYATHFVYYTCPGKMKEWVEVDDTTWTYQHTEGGTICYVFARVERHYYTCAKCGLNKVVCYTIEEHYSSEGSYTSVISMP